MQRLFGDFVRGKIGVLLEGARGGHRIVAAGADGRNAVIRLDDLARAGDDHQRFAAGDDQHGLQLAHGLVAAPFLRQLDGGALQIAGILLQLRLKAVTEREGVRNRSGKAGDDLTAVDAANLVRGRLEDGAFAHRHLTVARDGDFAVLPDGADGGALECHLCLPPIKTDVFPLL